VNDAAAEPPERHRAFVRSLEKGLNLLSLFSPERPRWSLTELAVALGDNKASVYRFAQTLEDLGYLQRDERKRYALTPRVLGLAGAYHAASPLAGVAGPQLERLSRETGESASLAVLDGAEVVYVARCAAERILSQRLEVGSRLPAHCTSMGKALLAERPWEEVERLYPLGFPRLTPHTVTDPDAVRRDLERTRARGFALNDQELEPGLRSVAAPVRDETGRAVAALNVSTSTGRVSLSDLERRVAPRLLEAARAVSLALGWRG
jgi:IclR family pca regulon transcriptional regulator